MKISCGKVFWFVGCVVVLFSLQAYPAKGEIKPRIDGPTASPDGLQVAFVAMKDKSKLCFLDFQTGTVQKVKVPGLFPEAFYGMSWDPNGKFLIITVVGGTKNDPGPWGIWKLSVADKKWTKILDLPKDICQRGLVSPIGNTVLLRAAIAQDLLLVDLKSGRKKFLTDSGDTYRIGYTWSPDGSKIYFSRGYQVKKGGLWVMNPDGTDKSLISDSFQPYNLAISPSGQYVAFMVTGGKKENYKDSLFVANLRKFKPVKISPQCAMFFHWSSKGDKLAFESSGLIKMLRLADKNTGRSKTVTIGKGTYPVWARQGRTILFLRNNRTTLWAYDVNMGKMKQIYSVKE